MAENKDKNGKSGKDEKKSDGAAPTSVTPEVLAKSADVPPVAALTVLPKSGIVIPSIEEVEKRAVLAVEKLQSFADLIQDPTLSDATKLQVKALLELAQPNKPGMEEVSTTWSVVRLSIAQPTTQAAAKPAEAKNGAIYTSAGELVEMPFGFIPLYFNHENIMFRTGEKNPECQSPDAKLGAPYGPCQVCPNLPFGQQNSGRGDQKKTDCQNQIVVAALSADMRQVYVMTFAKTSRSAGSALIALAKAHPFPWKQSYLLSTEKKTGELGTYYIYKVEPTGKNNTDDAIVVAKALSELYQANRRKYLGEFYLRSGSAAKTALAAEEAFNSGKLDAGLDPNRAGGEPEDLSPASAPPVARTAARPM